MFWLGMLLGSAVGALIVAFTCFIVEYKDRPKGINLWTQYGQSATIINVGVGGVVDSCGKTHSWELVESDYPLDDNRNAWYGKNHHYVAWKYKQMEKEATPLGGLTVLEHIAIAGGCQERKETTR